MKLRSFFIINLLAATLLLSHAAYAQRTVTMSKAQRVEQTVAAQPNVTVSLCVTSGDLTVLGTDARTVTARSHNAKQIKLRRTDNTDTTQPARRLEVLVADYADGSISNTDDCQAFSDMELEVPRGATVELRTRDGNVKVTDVTEARVTTMSGDISLQRITKAVDVDSVSGNISLKDASGRVKLSSSGGSVSVEDARPNDSDDEFEAKSLSGDVNLERVGHAVVGARTISGSVQMTGALAHGGRYGFKTMSGDVTLVLPPDSSFQVNAKTSQGGEIVSDFPLKLVSENSSKAQTAAQASSVTTPRPATAPTVAPAQTVTVVTPAPSVAPTPQTPKTPKAKEPKDKNKTPKPAVAPDAPDAPEITVVVPEIKVNTPEVKIVVPEIKMKMKMDYKYDYHRLVGTYGTGDATIDMASFSGSLHLRRK
ncbi:MAG: DUF4097 family beta strand repeat-containing protein [Pyrinomonadaceae bacterium]